MFSIGESLTPITWYIINANDRKTAEINVIIVR